MYQVKCMYPNAVIETLSNAKTATRAKELVSIYRKQGQYYMGQKAVEYWYQKADADIPDHITRITEWLLNRG